MIKGFLISMLLVAIFIQGTVSSIPFVIPILLLMYILYRSSWIFLAGFFAGFFIDSMMITSLGISSMYFILFILLVYLYEKKFEIQTRQFAILATGIGAIVYLYVTGGHWVLLHGLITSIIGLGIFEGFNYFNTVKQENSLSMSSRT